MKSYKNAPIYILMTVCLTLISAPAICLGANTTPLSSQSSFSNLKAFVALGAPTDLGAHFASFKAMQGLNIDANTSLVGALGAHLPVDFDARLSHVIQTQKPSEMYDISGKIQKAYDRAASIALTSVRNQVQDVGEAVARGEAGEQEVRQAADRLRPLTFYGPEVTQEIAKLDQLAADLLTADAAEAQEDAERAAQAFTPLRFSFEDPNLKLHFEVLPKEELSADLRNMRLDYDPRGLRPWHLLRRTFGPRALSYSKQDIHFMDVVHSNERLRRIRIEFKPSEIASFVSINRMGEIYFYPAEGMLQGLFTSFQHWLARKQDQWRGKWSPLTVEILPPTEH